MINATEILLAIKKYYLENNFYPKKLNELVPEYIDKLPIDPYSGNNFVFDYDKMIIYSIGEDYIDNGGSEETKQYKLMDEPTFSYDFLSL